MQEVTRDCIVSLAAFAGIFGIAYVFFMTRHRERMTMLDRNLIENPFNRPTSRPDYGLLSLKYGMLLVGFGIGYFMGWILYNYYGVSHSVSIVSMVCLFGGASLILNYIIVRKQGLNKE